MKGLRIAASFLTRVPVGIGERGTGELARGVPWFPVIGALVGLVGGAAYAGTVQIWSPVIAASLAVIVGVLVTGAFHEDGLADTADAFGGGKNKEDVLRILKDPRLGTFGVTALILVLLLRVLTIATFTDIDALIGLPVVGALSRAAAIVLLAGLGPAGDGLGATYAGASTTRYALAGTGFALVLGAVLLRSDTIPIVACMALVALVLARIAHDKVGGATGDILGATQQTTELAGLLFLAIPSE
jgi:adenosylcobinamide-GDP ribazoletransferase